MKRNARFWIYSSSAEGGYVKLTLRPGQSLSWGQFQYTDEGWSRTNETWKLSEDAETLYLSTCNDGVDCDGRLTRYWEGFAPADPASYRQALDYHCRRLDDGTYEHGSTPIVGVFCPNWREISSHQRDQFAEAMGY